jgi:spore coat protein SA
VHIVILAPEGTLFSDRRGGSIQIYIRHLANRLARLGHTVTVLTSNRTQRESWEIGVSVLPVSSGGNAMYPLQASRYLQTLRPDVVQVENRPQYIPAIRRSVDCPITLNLHSTLFCSPNRIRRTDLARIIEQIRGCTVNSRFLKNTLHAYVSGARERIRTIYPGVDPEQFPSRYESQDAWRRREFWRKSLGADHQFVILYAGRLIPRKGVTVLIEAFRQMLPSCPDATLWIVGGNRRPQNDYEKTLRRRAASLPVRFTGHVPPDAMANYYLGADVFVCPSQQEESFGLVNVEAMSTGLPVVASRQGGIPEVVGEDNGLLVGRYQDPGAFTESLLRLYQAPEWREQSGRMAAKTVRKTFDWQATAEAFSQYYQEICENQPGRKKGGNRL